MVPCHAPCLPCSRNKDSTSHWRPCAPALIAEMHALRLLADVIRYAAAISACEESKEWQGALMLFGEIPLQVMPADVVTYAATSNPGGFVKGLTPTVLQAMQATCGLTWACWVVGAGATATKSGGKKE